MTTTGLGQMLAFLALLVFITKPLGAYMADVFEGKRTFAARLLLPVERLIYVLTGFTRRTISFGQPAPLHAFRSASSDDSW